MNRVRVGVIGLGQNGRAFCNRYIKNPKCELVAVCDIDGNRLQNALDAYGGAGVKGYKDDEILSDKNIDAISIHTPDCFHKEPFVNALKTNHHVFVEKPMADSIEDIQDMVDAYRKHNDKTVQVGHVLRFDKYFSLIKKFIAQGSLGDIFYLEADYIHDLRYQLYQEKWKITTESPMIGGGCHPLDILRWYVGDAVEVNAMSNNIAFPEMVEDATIIAMFKFQNGAIGKVTSIYGCVNPRPYGFNLSVYGTKGTVLRNQLSLDGLGEQWMELPLTFDPHHDFTPEIEHFLTCILNNQKPLITPEDAANTVISGLYALKSAREKRTLEIPAV